jgi:KTSC domain-containing protein
VQREPVESSVITSVGYDASSRTLEVEFTSGKVYQFFDVPADLAQALRAAESHGAFFNTHVRSGGYAYALVEP